MATSVLDPVRVAIIGCGAVAERYHLPALLASPEVRLVAMVDPVLERARDLAARAHATRACAPAVLDSHTDLPAEVDLALLAVPNAFHEPIACDLLRAGLHVLVEKPMARSTAECDRMLASAATTGAVLAIGHDFRHYPVARYAHDLFASGLLGPVRRVDVSQSTGVRWPAVSTAVLTKEAGGGVLLDFGVHLLDLLLWWLGDLHVVTYRDDALGGVEAECECEMQLATGAPVRMELSRTRIMRDTAVVECERGAVELGIFDPAVIRLSIPGVPPLAGSVHDGEFDRAPMRTVFRRQIADLVTAIRERRDPLVPGWQGRRAVSLVEACYRLRIPIEYPWDVGAAYASVGRTGP